MSIVFQVTVYFAMELLHFQTVFPILVSSYISLDLYLFSDCCSPLESKVFTDLTRPFPKAVTALI